MEVLVAIVVYLTFLALGGLLARWEIKRYKAAIAREEEHLSLYKKISRKLDEM